MLERITKGSFTVEAAILIPIYLFIMMGTIRIGILLYSEIKADNEIQKAEQLWAVEDFYRNELVGELLEHE